MLNKVLASTCSNAPFSGKFQDSITAAVSISQDGNMSLSYGDTSSALDNRKIYLASLGIDYKDLVCAKQVHSSGIKKVGAADKGRGASTYDDAVSDTDAFITDLKNIPLAIFTADCLSVFIYDSRKPAIGVVHAGWRSTKENIVSKTIALMNREFGCRSQDLCVGFGPAIRNCCYVVGEELSREFPDFAIKRNNSIYLDLAGINRKEALAAGIRKENIYDQGLCTACQNSGYFSYRRKKEQAGRIMSVIMLK